MTKNQIYQIGILGCGDFLRWMAPTLNGSQLVTVKWLYDLDRERAVRYASELGGQVADSPEKIFSDPEVEIAGLFVPPWVRPELWSQAARAGKHVLATKPLAADIPGCEQILTTKDQVRSGVLYSRSGDGWSVALKNLLESGKIGNLVLYRQDWIHHYPQWNTWALDPAKNGGPFMDAMIHNLNQARYLMGRPITGATFFSEKLSHPDLTCADTEALKLQFEANGSALLFITWAADLSVYSTEINDRENVEVFYLITDRGWRITKQWGKGGAQIIASRGGKQKTWQAADLGGTVFDRFTVAVQTDTEMPEDIVSVEMAAEDIILLRRLAETPNLDLAE